MYEEIESNYVGITALSADLTPYVTVTNWDLTDASEESIFTMSGLRYGVSLQFSFAWNLTLTGGQTIQNGDEFRFRRPETPALGHFAFINTTFENFTNDNGDIIGQWRIENNYIIAEFTNHSVGSATATGFFETGLVITNLVASGGTHNVTFAGDSRPVYFILRTLTQQRGIQGKGVGSASNDRVQWWMELNRLGLLELTGNEEHIGYGHPLGTHFTQQSGFYFEDVLNGEFVSIVFQFRITVPVSLSPDDPEFGMSSDVGAATFYISNHVTRVYQETPSQTYADFKASLNPFQWGVWEDGDGVQTVVAYFGTLGVDGPTVYNINENFAVLAANSAIVNGFYLDYHRSALEEYFYTAFGSGNVINGRLPSIRINLTERFVPVTSNTAVTNTMTVTRNGVDTNSSATATLRPIDGGAGTVPGESARLTLTDQVTNEPLAGVNFQLQILQGGNWINFTGNPSVFTTDAEGNFVTQRIGAGTFRFIQVNYLANYHLPSSNGFVGAPLNTVVSEQFVLTPGGDGQAVYVENIRRFEVRYTVAGVAPTTFTPAIPAPVYQVHATQNISVAPPLTSALTTHNGVLGSWRFSGWTTTNATVTDNLFTMPANDVVFTGNWTFIASPTITKAATPTISAVGEEITYSITVTNSNNHVLDGEFTVVDNINTELVEFLPESLVVTVGGTALDEEYFEVEFSESGELRVIFNSLASGNTVVTFSVEVLPAAEGQAIRNAALLETPPDLPSPPETPYVETPVPTITKIANTATSAVGDQIIYTIEVNNPGEQAVTGDFAIIDMIDIGLVNFMPETLAINGTVSTAFTFSASTGELRVPLSPLPAGETVVTFSVEVLPTAAGQVVRNIAVLETPPDMPEIPETPEVEVPVLTITKTANRNAAYVGDEITYTITAVNPSDEPLTGNFAIVDNIDIRFVRFISESLMLNGEPIEASGFTFNEATGQLRVPLNPLESGNTVVTFDVEVLPAAYGQVVSNVAVLTTPPDVPTPPETPPVDVPVAPEDVRHLRIYYYLRDGDDLNRDTVHNPNGRSYFYSIGSVFDTNHVLDRNTLAGDTEYVFEGWYVYIGSQLDDGEYITGMDVEELHNTFIVPAPGGLIPLAMFEEITATNNSTQIVGETITLIAVWSVYEAEETTTGGGGGAGKTLPRTGIENDTSLWAILFVIMLLLAVRVAIGIRSEKNKRNEALDNINKR